MKSSYKVRINNLQKIILVACWGLLFFSPSSEARYQYTPADAYVYALKIEHELEIIRQHFKVAKVSPPKRLAIILKPRNVWQKTYEIFIKINILREKHNLPRLDEAVLEPVKNISSWLVYEQLVRILAELDIFKTYIGITKQAKTPLKSKEKTSTDVYYLLNLISLQLDEISGKKITPSFVFAQNMRILEDVNTILSKLQIRENSSPPNRHLEVTPNDVFKTSLLILAEINRLQTIANVNIINFKNLKKEDIVSEDVFAMSGMIISGLQPIKAYLKIKNVTPTAIVYEGKEPADALQVLGWALRKIKQIKRLD